MENSIAIVLARGGSKRIPGKNTREFMGKPSLAYPIDAAKASGLFQEIMVSTDDPSIAELALKLGASVPFMRSHETAGDYATTADAVKEVVDKLHDHDLHYSYLCVLYPTALLIQPSHIQRGFEQLQSGDYDSVLSMQELRHPAGRALRMEKGLVQFQWPENALIRSQDLPKSFIDAGQFYWLRTKSFLDQGKILMEKSGGVLLDFFDAQDIDEEEDWKIAEWKYRYREMHG